jgi:tetratricopeptide (TPR) repeat protein
VGTFLEDRDRTVIPRLRSFRTTLLLGELDPAGLDYGGDSESLEDEESSLESKIVAWNERGTVSFAADLVSAALVLGQPDRAKDAAEFLLSRKSQAPHAARQVAKKILELQPADGRRAVATVEVSLPHEKEIYQRIHSVRQQLGNEPRNAILWVELSRVYAFLGLAEKAEHAMDVAVGLGPTNRFILRSASRLYVHVDELGKAHKVLQRAQSTKYDPWLLSAEIAAASAAARTSRFVKTGQRMLLDDSLSPFQKNELASAIATLELSHGKVKSGRNLLRQALLDPTENSVAQAEWALRKRYVEPLGLDLERIKNETPRSFEARAWGHYSSLRWKEALHASFDWVRDQPFSARPVFFGSYVAGSLLEDYRSCERIIEIGLRANPDQPILLNDLAFVYASAGEIDKAEERFRRIDHGEIKDLRLAIAMTATKGLLRFRRGFDVEGRALYRAAIENAKKHRLHRATAIASIYLAREEVLSKSVEAKKAQELALHETQNVTDPDIKQIFENAFGSADLVDTERRSQG